MEAPHTAVILALTSEASMEQCHKVQNGPGSAGAALQMLPQPSMVNRAEPTGKKVEWVCLAGVAKG